MRCRHVCFAACQDGFAEENAIYGGYNQAPASSSGEMASGLLRLLDNFTLYVQTDEEGSEELVDLQDLSRGICWFLLHTASPWCYPLVTHVA